MKPWLGFLILGVCFVVYLLYRRGIVITRSVAAVLFFLRTGKTRDRAALDSCTGWVRHRGRFGETGIYTFTLDFRLSRGDAAVLLLDGKSGSCSAWTGIRPAERQSFTGKTGMIYAGNLKVPQEGAHCTGSAGLFVINIPEQFRGRNNRTAGMTF